MTTFKQQPDEKRTKMLRLANRFPSTLYKGRITFLSEVYKNVITDKPTIKQAQKYPFIQDILKTELAFYRLSDADKNACLDAVLATDVHHRAALKEKECEEDDELDYVDHLVKELLRWFKEEFFTWVNKPPCDKCGNSDQNKIRRLQARKAFRKEHLEGWASVVEIYKCLECNAPIVFARYNKAETLIRERRGRCGEWNNCFLSILRSLDIESRYIRNMEDHVWCEYFSRKQGRWIHLDSCENSYDQPMLYCDGWGKKMSYVFAANNRYIIDVTDKYINPDKPEMRLAIDKEQDKHLQAVLAITNATKLVTIDRNEFMRLTSSLVSDAKKTAEKKIEKEKIKAATTKDDLLPRQSGDANWTKERGEDGQ